MSRARLELASFLPYRLSVLTNTVSATLAQQYGEQFGLTIPEWRVMAVLGIEEGLTASEVGMRTAMDKVSISRAVQGLQQAGRVSRRTDRADRRRKRLRLTVRGREVYVRIVPLARDFEGTLRASLSATEVESLDRLLTALQRSADQLARERSGGRTAA